MALLTCHAKWFEPYPAGIILFPMTFTFWCHTLAVWLVCGKWDFAGVIEVANQLTLK